MWTFVKQLMRILPDWVYISLKYYYHFKRFPNLKNPKTFNEKLQWLKLYDRKPIYTTMVDKYEAKKYVADKIGEEYIVPTYGVWERFDDIDFDSLPEQFVLKSTHDCGGVVIVRDNSCFNQQTAKGKLDRALENNYFWESREWPYKEVRPRILAERFLFDGEHANLIVYKVFCFNGEPRIIQVIQDDKQINESIDYFDVNWNLLPFRQNYPNSETHLPKPEHLDKMLELSKKLSEGMAFIRIDWYSVKEKLLFSEYTFYSDAGTAKFHPEKWDNILGQWITLPNKK